MKRKFIALLLLVSMMFVFGACDNSEEKPAEKKEESTVETSKESADEKTAENTEELSEEESEFADGEWKEYYAEYLLENMQEMNAHVMYYEKGDGKFALKDITGDRIPELFVVGDESMCYIYKFNDESKLVETVAFADGGTDVVFMVADKLKFGEGGVVFTEELEDRFDYWVPAKDGVYDFVIQFHANKYNDRYVCNVFDTERLCREGFEYRMEYIDNEVDEDEYNATLESYRFKDGEYTTLEDAGMYSITPEDVNAVLG